MFLEAADSHAPIKRRCVKGTHPPWMTQAISEGMRSRDYHHKAIKTGSSYHWRMFKQQRNYVNNEINLKQANRIILSGRLRKARGVETKYGRLLMKLPAENVSSLILPV